MMANRNGIQSSVENLVLDSISTSRDVCISLLNSSAAKVGPIFIPIIAQTIASRQNQLRNSYELYKSQNRTGAHRVSKIRTDGSRSQNFGLDWPNLNQAFNFLLWRRCCPIQLRTDSEESKICPRKF
ncbi:hypothetical protein Mapa_012748 [Marchantia paleacea]|nr:hypothetical protein Mapa_012748 [Marchantia paleacea]